MKIHYVTLQSFTQLQNKLNPASNNRVTLQGFAVFSASGSRMLRAVESQIEEVTTDIWGVTDTQGEGFKKQKQRKRWCS